MVADEQAGAHLQFGTGEAELPEEAADELESHAVDLMVFNVTKDEIRIRMAVVDEDIWPMPSALGNISPDPALQRTKFSDMMLSGRVVHTDILEEIYAEINELYGTSIPVPK